MSMKTLPHHRPGLYTTLSLSLNLLESQQRTLHQSCKGEGPHQMLASLYTTLFVFILLTCSAIRRPMSR